MIDTILIPIIAGAVAWVLVHKLSKDKQAGAVVGAVLGALVTVGVFIGMLFL